MLLGTVPLLVLSGRKNAEIVCVVVCERRVNKRVWLCFGIKQKWWFIWENGKTAALPEGF